PNSRKDNADGAELERAGPGELRRPLPSVGERQLAFQRPRLQRGQGRVAGALLRARTAGGTVELLALLPRRGLGRPQPVALHRRGAVRGAEVLSRDAAG